MVFAVALGLVTGVLGFLPLFASLRLARKATATSNLGHAGSLMLGVLLSFAVLFVPAIVCALNFRDVVLFFVGGEAAALVLTAIAFGFAKLVRK